MVQYQLNNMDELQIQKVNRFLSDEVMSDTVHSVLLETFLKPRKSDDVHVLAASRVAIDLLQEAWKELKKLRFDNEKTTQGGGNIGV